MTPEKYQTLMEELRECTDKSRAKEIYDQAFDEWIHVALLKEAAVDKIQTLEKEYWEKREKENSTSKGTEND